MYLHCKYYRFRIIWKIIGSYNSGHHRSSSTQPNNACKSSLLIHSWRRSRVLLHSSHTNFVICLLWSHLSICNTNFCWIEFLRLNSNILFFWFCCRWRGSYWRWNHRVLWGTWSDQQSWWLASFYPLVTWCFATNVFRLLHVMLNRRRCAFLLVLVCSL